MSTRMSWQTAILVSVKWLSPKQILLIAKSIRVGTEANFNQTSTLEFEIFYCQHEKWKTQEMPGSEDGNQLGGSQIARNLPTAASYEIVPWFSRPNRPLCTCARIVPRPSVAIVQAAAHSGKQSSGAKREICRFSASALQEGQHEAQNHMLGNLSHTSRNSISPISTARTWSSLKENI